ncbi:MAG: DUF1461 domain-containing protein [Chloroflexi bacterium]|nr:DUF1461 domain-containing protein [Chloroflexota bacterium]
MRPFLGLASGVVSLSVALSLVAAVVAPFLTPAWIGFEQGRSDATGWTGYGPADLTTATDGILHDLVLGPPDFAVEVGGVPVLTESERAHMRDVRGVFTGFYAVSVAAVVLVAAAALLARGSRARPAGWTRERFWRAVRRGAIGLAAGLGIAGVVALVAFDAAFEVFHRLFFPVGTYDFDPRIYRLTQLFPDAFWSETSLVVGAGAVIVAIAVAVIATRRIGGAHPAVAPALAAAGR